MAKVNGTAGWIKLALYIIATVAALAIAYGQIGHAVEDNTDFRVGDGAKNTEQRITYEVDTPWIKSKISDIEKNVAAIEEDISDYAEEQRGVNQEILDKLDER